MKRRLNVNELILILGIDVPAAEACTGKGKESITDAQRTYLHNLGVNISGITCRGQACEIIDKLVERQKLGLATLQQILVIRNMKIRVRKPFQFLTYSDAGKIIAKHLYP